MSGRAPGQERDPLGELGRDIQRLDAIVRAGERQRQERERRRESADHLLLQVRRLRAAARSLRRRMEAIDKALVEGSISRDEAEHTRDAFARRDRVLREKVATLQAARAARPSQQARQIRRGAHAMLHRRLLQAIHRMRGESDVDMRRFRRFRERAAELVRMRRLALEESARAVAAARDHVVVFVKLVEAPDLPTLVLEPRAFDLLGAALRDFSEALDRIELLAQEWPEFEGLLETARSREEPLESLLYELRDTGLDGLGLRPGASDREQADPFLGAARQVALWLDRLARALRDAPPPPMAQPSG